MSIAGALTRLDELLVLAGTSVTPNITNIAGIERESKDRRIDYWIDDIGDPARMGGFTETLTDRMFGTNVNVRVSIPVRDQRETLGSNIETDLATVTLQVAIRVLGDADLGAQCTAVKWQGSTFGWIKGDDGTWQRVSNTALTLDFVETVTITL